jgi:cytochrome c-type biogenesis protein CcmF
MIGNIFLMLALLASIFTIFAYFYAYKGNEKANLLARIGFHVITLSVIGASIFLLHAILTHQFQFKYVFDYSDKSLPLGLLISSFYAGQSGSILLWALFGVIIGQILLEYTSKRDDLEPRVMMLYTFTLFFLLLLNNPLMQNPFTYIWDPAKYIPITKINRAVLSFPFMNNFVFQDPQSSNFFVKVSHDLVAKLLENGITINNLIVDGNGLNPLLQNFWMQIHPPFLFVGFAMSAVPFSFAIAALIKNDYKNWVKQSLPWLLAVALVLGIAIMLGGYWAYGVLGWGGWWGWDPVENSSLVPWIVAVAGIHTMLVQKKTEKQYGGVGRFVKTNLILSLFTYILVIYSTFLTRSGVLSDASVHSFVAPGQIVFLLLLIFIIFFTLFGLIFLIYRWSYLEKHFTFEDNLFSRELALFTGSVALIAAAVIILFGTSLPIFGNTVDISFYNKLVLPLAIIMAFVNALSLLLKWNSTPVDKFIKEMILPVSVSVFVTVLVVLIGKVYNINYILLVFFTVMSFEVNLEFFIRVVKKQIIKTGAYVAHIGIAIFALGVIFNGGYSQTKHVALPKGEEVSVFGHQLKFTGIEPFYNGKRFKFHVVVKDGNDIDVVSPVMFFSEMDGGLMREPSVLNYWTKDFYISPLSYDEGKNKSHRGKEVSLSKGESKVVDGVNFTFNDFDLPDDFVSKMQSGEKFTLGVNLTADIDGKKYSVDPQQIMDHGKTINLPAKLENGFIVKIVSIKAAGSVKLNIISPSDKQVAPKEVFSANISIKPFVSFIWIGVLIMGLGFIFSILYRIKDSWVVTKDEEIIEQSGDKNAE